MCKDNLWIMFHITNSMEAQQYQSRICVYSVKTDAVLKITSILSKAVPEFGWFTLCDSYILSSALIKSKIVTQQFNLDFTQDLLLPDTGIYSRVYEFSHFTNFQIKRKGTTCMSYKKIECAKLCQWHIPK